MTKRASATKAALLALLYQVLLLLDQALNAVVLGLQAVLLAAITGNQQATCYADETLSAHAWRAEQARKPWARVLRPVIDALWSWQSPAPEVNAAAGRLVTSHCERAFWKKRLRLGLPVEYQSLER